MSQTAAWQEPGLMLIRAALVADAGFTALIAAKNIWIGDQVEPDTWPQLRIRMNQSNPIQNLGPGEYRPTLMFEFSGAENVSQMMAIALRLLSIPTIRNTSLESATFRIDQLICLDDRQPVGARPLGNGMSLLLGFQLWDCKIVQKTQD